jgi:hypothetical protein
MNTIKSIKSFTHFPIKRIRLYHLFGVILLILPSSCSLKPHEWIQVDTPGSVEKFLGVAIEDDVCYSPYEIDFYISLSDKSIYECPVGGNCTEVSISSESMHEEESGGLGTFCSFLRGRTPDDLPEGHGAIQDALWVSGGERDVIDIYYVIFEDGTLWSVKIPR